MRNSLFFSLVITIVPLEAETIRCAVAPEVYNDVRYLFDSNIEYSNLKVKTTNSKNNLDAIETLLDKRVDFAIIRADILHRLKEVNNPKSQKYNIIGKLPIHSKLFLIQDGTSPDIYLDELKGKIVSAGELGDSSSHLLKSILTKYSVKNSVLMKANNLEASLDKISSHNIDAYFGFLRDFRNDGNFNIQTIFSEETIIYLKSNPRGTEVGEYEVQVPYIIISRVKTSVEYIKNIIYRLKAHQAFIPIKNDKFGKIYRSLGGYIKDIDGRLDKKSLVSVINNHSTTRHSSRADCKKYRYGFLKLLRRKPNIKKILNRVKTYNPKYYIEAQGHVKRIEKILLSIDANKEKCSNSFIENKKDDFLNTERKLKKLYIQ